MLVTPVCGLWMYIRSKRRVDYIIFHTLGVKVDKMDEGNSHDKRIMSQRVGTYGMDCMDYMDWTM